MTSTIPAQQEVLRAAANEAAAPCKSAGFC
jgi:hypothetical protein